jgi:hypothetical protein
MGGGERRHCSLGGTVHLCLPPGNGGLVGMLQSTCCWVGHVAKRGVGGEARRLPRWTLLGSGKEEVAMTDEESNNLCLFKRGNKKLCLG